MPHKRARKSRQQASATAKHHEAKHDRSAAEKENATMSVESAQTEARASSTSSFPLSAPECAVHAPSQPTTDDLEMRASPTIREASDDSQPSADLPDAATDAADAPTDADADADAAADTDAAEPTDQSEDAQEDDAASLEEAKHAFDQLTAIEQKINAARADTKMLPDQLAHTCVRMCVALWRLRELSRSHPPGPLQGQLAAVWTSASSYAKSLQLACQRLQYQAGVKGEELLRVMFALDAVSAGSSKLATDIRQKRRALVQRLKALIGFTDRMRHRARSLLPLQQRIDQLAAALDAAHPASVVTPAASNAAADTDIPIHPSRSRSTSSASHTSASSDSVDRSRVLRDSARSDSFHSSAHHFPRRREEEATPPSPMRCEQTDSDTNSDRVDVDEDDDDTVPVVVNLRHHHRPDVVKRATPPPPPPSRRPAAPNLRRSRFDPEPDSPDDMHPDFARYPPHLRAAAFQQAAPSYSYHPRGFWSPFGSFF